MASWQHTYIGVGMVYKASPSLGDFQDASPYWSALTSSGFNAAGGYTFFGQYHAPISAQGSTTAQQKYYFKWQRAGNVLTLTYSVTGATGPWTNFNPTFTATCASTDRIIIGGYRPNHDFL